MAFKNRIRLPIYLKGAQFPTEANRFRLANGTSKTLSVVIRKTYLLVTDYLPERMHQRLTIALNHDEVNIEGDRYAGGVSVDGDYKIEWPDFLDYPLAQAEVQIQVTPFAATNDNCQTCEEITQITLQDDTIEDPISEGDVVTLNVFDNDAICCSPITAEVISFDTSRIASVTLDELGEMIITFKDPATSGDNLLLVTYRVTCPNGGYDEAGVYGSVEGEAPSCTPPSALTYTHVGDNNDQVSWTGPGPVYQWRLYNCSNLGTPIDSGTGIDTTITFDDLAPGGCYVFSVRTICGVLNNSTWEDIEFNVPGVVESCGQFVLTNNNYPDTALDSCSFMNCEGIIENIVVKTTRVVCMMTETGNVPSYFQSSQGVTTYEYSGVCADEGPFIVQVSGDNTLISISGILHDVSMPISGGTDAGTWTGFTGGSIGFNITAGAEGLIRVYYDGLQVGITAHAGTGSYSVDSLPAASDGVEIRIELS